MMTTTNTFQEPELTCAQRWGLRLSALLTAMNNDPQDTLYRGATCQEDAEEIAAIMKRDWRVETRQEYLDMLEWLKKDGHNTDYMRLRRILTGMTEHERDQFIHNARHNEEFQNQAILVRNYLFTLDDIGIAAWDQGRYVSLCQWGATTGVLGEQEALEMVLAMARKVQPCYQSWHQYGLSYTIGRQFWYGLADQENAREEQDRLLGLLRDANSVWRSLDWQTPLGSPN